MDSVGHSEFQYVEEENRDVPKELGETELITPLMHYRSSRTNREK